MERERVLGRILQERIIAVIREDNSDDVPAIIDALCEEGIRIIEITLTTPEGAELISTYAERKELIIGGGSVLTIDQMEQIAVAGAQFYASPVTNHLILTSSAARGMVTIPGALTPNEIQQAVNLGADLVKIFPFPTEGPSYLTSLLGPLPNLRLAPSGGISASNAGDLLLAGASALNIGSWLTPKAESLPRRLDILRRRCEQLRKAIQVS